MQSNQMKCFNKNENFNIVLTLWPTDCTKFQSSEICCCECQWTEAEQNRMQLITERPNVPRGAFSIIASNCHLLIPIDLHINFIYVLLICNFFALIWFQLFKNSTFSLINWYSRAVIYGIYEFSRYIEYKELPLRNWTYAAELKFLAMIV